jgi:hypothetical protein
MSTQATTTNSVIRTAPIVREYRVQRATGSQLLHLLRRLRGTRPVDAQLRWQPVAPAAPDLQVEMARAYQRLLVR